MKPVVEQADQRGHPGHRGVHRIARTVETGLARRHGIFCSWRRGPPPPLAQSFNIELRRDRAVAMAKAAPPPRTACPPKRPGRKGGTLTPSRGFTCPRSGVAAGTLRVIHATPGTTHVARSTQAPKQRQLLRFQRA